MFLYRDSRMVQYDALLKPKVKAISENRHTTLRVFLHVFGVVEALTHIVHYVQAPRLEDE